MSFLLLLFWDHIQWCSGLSPGSVLMIILMVLWEPQEMELELICARQEPSSLYNLSGPRKGISAKPFFIPLASKFKRSNSLQAGQIYCSRDGACV